MKGVIFDMDGVLVLTGQAHFRAWRATAAESGIDLDFETFSHTFGLTNPDVIRKLWLREVGAEEGARIAERKERAFREEVRASVPFAPGVHALLRELAEGGFTMGVGSSAPRENLDMVLDAGSGGPPGSDDGPIRVFFASVVDGSMVTRGKPDPEVFVRAARLAGLVPERCVVIEDAPAGILAARAAGMGAIGLATTHGREALEEAGAHVVYDALADLSAARIAAVSRRR